RTTARAALSASTAAASGDRGRATSVGWTRGRSPAASPTSPYWLVENVLLTVNGPAGSTSIDSSASRSASVAGQARPVTGTTGSAGSSSTTTAAASAATTWVSPLNSATVPVTSTWSPA